MSLSAERGSAEQLLRHERDFNAALLDSLAALVVVLDRDGRIVRFNRACEAATGYRADEVLGQSVFDLLIPEEERVLERLRVGELSSQHENRWRTKDGRERLIAWHSTFVTGDDGRVELIIDSGTDITDRQAAEERLRDAQERLRALSEATSDALILHEHGTVLEVNDTFTALFGYAAHEIIGRNSFELTVPPEARPGMLEQVKRKARGPFQSIGLRKDGSTFICEIRAKDVAYQGRSVRVASVRDITHLKHAEEDLRKAHKLLKAITDATPDLVFVKDREGRLLLANPATAAVLGASEAQILGKTEIEHLGEELGRPISENDRRVMESGQTQVMEEVVYPGGRRTVFLSAKSPLRDESGSVVGLVGIARDITERKAAEERLQRSEQRFQLAARATNDVIWDWDLASDALWWSSGLESLFGYRHADVSATIAWWCEHIHADDRERVVAGIRAVVEGSESFWREEYRFRRADGTYADVFDRGYVMRDAQGRAERMLGAMQDQSARKQAEQALKEADRRKDEFLATLAHELRNPLAPIRNAVQLMRLRGTADEALQSARDMIDRQVTHMVRLIDDLLDVSRITRGKLELRRQRVALAEVIEQALDTARPHIGHELTVSLPPEPLCLYADSVRLAQLFSNLLNNAAKFTEKGGRIRVSAQREGRDVLVTVADSGIGIAAEHLPHVFEMFSQASPPLERSSGGLGIGLAVVRGLAELHGGSVAARSGGFGKGAEFVVRLPALQAAPESVEGQKPAGRAALPGARRLLVVEDNLDAAQSLAVLLRLEGSEVELAHDGVVGVHKALEWRPDAVLLDIGLPFMNGYEVCRAIRAEPWAARLPIIALTGWGQEDDRRKTREAGFDAHLVKPVELRELMELLSRLMST